MAKKGGNDFDNMDFDDLDGFGDLDALDAMLDPSKDTRDPKTKVKDAFKESVKDNIKSPSYIKKLLRNALPEEYGSAFDALDHAADKSEQLYNKTADQLAPTIKEIRKKTKTILPAVERMLPKKLADKLKDWANDDYDYKPMSQGEQDSAQLTLEMANIFKAQTTLQHAQMEKVKKQNLISEALQSKRHVASMVSLDRIARGIGRLVGYQDEVTVKYQQKSLELQYRSLFMQRDILTTMKSESLRHLSRLDAIVTNTGLPDAIKLTKTEVFTTKMRDKFVDKVQSRAFKSVNDITDRVLENLGGVVQERTDAFKYAVQDILGLADMLDGGMGMDGYQLAGNVGGTLASEAAAEGLGGAARRFLDRNPKLKSMGVRVATLLANAGGEANKFVASETDMGNGGFLARLKAWGLNAGKDLMRGNRGYSLNTNDMSNGIEDPAIFDRKVSKSITEIIPGFLSRILREVTVISTGDKKTPFINYNLTRGKFTTYSVKKDDITRRMIKSKGHNTIRNDLKHFVGNTLGGGNLSPEAYEALRRQMMLNIKDGHNSKGFNVKDLSDAGNYDASISPAARQELAEHFTREFRTNENLKVGDDVDLDQRVLAVTKRFQTIGRNIPEVINEMELQLRLGNVEVLEEMGLMRETVDGTSELDHEKLVLFLMGEDDASKKSSGGPEATQSTFHFVRRKRRGYDRSDMFGGAKYSRKPTTGDTIRTSLLNAVNTVADPAKRAKVVKKAKRSGLQVINTVRNKNRRDSVIDETRRKAESLLNSAKTKANDLVEQYVDDDIRYQSWLLKDAIKKKYNRTVEVGTEFFNEARAKAKKYAEEWGIFNYLKDKAEIARYYSWFIRREIEERYGVKIPTTLEEGKTSITEIIERAKIEYRNARRTVEAQIPTLNNLASNVELPTARYTYSGNSKFSLRNGMGQSGSAAPAMNVSASIKDKFGNIWQQVKSGTSKARGSISDAIRNLMTNNGNESGDLDSDSGGSNVSDFKKLVTDKLTSIEAILQESNALLKAGMVIQSERDTNGQGRRYGLRYGLRSGVAKLFDTGAGFAKNMFFLYGKLMKGAGHLGLGALKGAGSILAGGGKLIGGALGMQRYYDIYVRGDEVPTLYASALRKGHYRDSVTGKVVKSIKDIERCQGSIVDANDNDNVVLGPEQIAKGLFTKKGEPIPKKLFRGMLNFYSTITLGPLNAALAVTKWATKGVWNLLTKPKDIYVRGEPVPRMLSKIMETGGYFSKRTGNVIRSHKDIDGEVVDRNGNLILSMEDLAPPKGIVDRSGKPIETLAAKLGRWALKGITATAKAAWSTVKFGLRLGMLPIKLGLKILGKSWKINKWLTGASALDQAKIQIESKSVEILASIYELLDKRLPGKKRFGDTDGDGIRENSAEDRMRRRGRKSKAARDAAAAGGAGGAAGGANGKNGAEGGSSGFSLMEMLGGSAVMAKAGSILSKGKGLVTGIGKGAWNMAKGVGRFAGGARMASMAGTALTAVRGAAAATALAGSLGYGVGGVLGAAAAILGSPLVIGALVVGAVAGIGYLGYKYYKSKHKAQFKKLRMLHYGVKSGSDTENNCSWLEEYLMKHISMANGNATIDIKPENVKEIFERFGIRESDEPKVRVFLNWFEDRFKPVYLANVAVLQSTIPSGKLEDLDGKLSAEQKASMLNKLKRTPQDPIFRVVDSPFSEPLEADFAAMKVIEEEILKDAPKPKNTFDAFSAGTGIVATSLAIDANGNPIKPGAKPNLKSAGVGTTVVGGAAMAKGVADSMSKPTPISSNVKQGSKPANLSALDCTRFKTYGLKEMEIDKVRALQDLEAYVFAEVTFDKDNKATYDKSADAALDQFAGQFGVPPTDYKARFNWTTWFTNRFLTVFLNFCSVLRAENKNAIYKDAGTFLKPNQLLNVANLIVATNSSGWFWKINVWTLQHSPWPGYELNTDSATTKGNIKNIENSAKAVKLQDTADLVGADILGSFENKPKDAKPGAGILSNIFGQGNSDSGGMFSSEPNGGNTPSNPAQVSSVPDSIRKTMTKGSKTGAYGNKQYIMPSEGTITSPFGMRNNPTNPGQKKFHHGIDIGAPAGTIVRATADGIITRREYTSDYGNLIIIKHNDGKTSRYGHMLRFQSGIAVGSIVKQGDIIGYVGSTGRSTGNHLHFEIRDGSASNSAAIDPITVLDKAGPTGDMVKDLKAHEEESKKGFGVDMSLEGLNTISEPAPKSALSGILAPIPSPVAKPSVANNTENSYINKPTDNAGQALDLNAANKSISDVNKAMLQERDKLSQSNSDGINSAISMLLRKSLDVQMSMDTKLGSIETSLKTISQNANGLGAASTPQESEATKKGNRPTKSNVVNNPVSMRKTQY